MIERIIDAHCLVGTDYWLSKNKPELAHENDLKEYKKEMEKYVKEIYSLIMPFPSSCDDSYILENEHVLKLHSENTWAEPILAFNSRSEENFRYICNKLEEGKVKGLVLWPILCDLNLSEMKDNEYFNYLVEHYDCWFTVHVGAGNEQDIKRVKKLNNYGPKDAIQLAKDFPNVKFNLAHLLRISESALEEAKKLHNIVIDISGISTHQRWYEHETNVFAASDAGALGQLSSSEIIYQLMNTELNDKLVFGTQYPFGQWYGFDINKELELILSSGLSRKMTDKLFYQNFNYFINRRLRDAKKE